MRGWVQFSHPDCGFRATPGADLSGGSCALPPRAWSGATVFEVLTMYPDILSTMFPVAQPHQLPNLYRLNVEFVSPQQQEI